MVILLYLYTFCNVTGRSTPGYKQILSRLKEVRIKTIKGVSSHPGFALSFSLILNHLSIKTIQAKD